MNMIIKQLFLVIYTVILITGLFGCKPQNIDRNIEHWHPYQVVIDGVELKYKLPPQGRFFIKPSINVDTKTFSKNQEYNAILVVGYDYGNNWSDDISQFRFGFGLVRYVEPLDAVINVEELALKVAQESQSQVVIGSELVEIGRYKWFYEYLRNVHGAESESYAIPFDNEYYLSFGASFSDEILSNDMRLKDRQKLLKEIVSTVRIRNI